MRKEEVMKYNHAWRDVSKEDICRASLETQVLEALIEEQIPITCTQHASCCNQGVSDILMVE